MTWTLSNASHVVIYFLEINLQNVVFQVLSFGFSKHVVRGIFRVAKWWHGVYGVATLKQAPMHSFGDLLSDMHSCVHKYCITIKYSSTLFKMKNK